MIQIQAQIAEAARLERSRLGDIALAMADAEIKHPANCSNAFEPDMGQPCAYCEARASAADDAEFHISPAGQVEEFRFLTIERQEDLDEAMNREEVEEIPF
jgi:hypothetical protein